MGSVVLVLLLLGWAAVLLPAAFRRRVERRRGDSITDFRDRLAVLHRNGARAHGRRLATPVRSSAKRRRDVLAGLLAAALGSALLALVPGFGALWALHLVLDVLLVAYVTLLLRARQAATLPTGDLRTLRVAPRPAAVDRSVIGSGDDDPAYPFAWSHAANE